MKVQKKWVLCAMGILLSVGSVFSQTLKQTIRGQVLDIDSRSPLIGVALYIEGTEPMIGVVTNLDGYFTFPELPVGRYNIVVNYLGYEQKMISNLLIGAGKEAYLNIDLEESVKKLDEVVVTARKNKGEPLNDMASVSARSFTVEETQRYAGSFNDPSRMVSSYAGVTGDPDGNNDIAIRGNSPRGLLWRVEGIEVPNPNHFANEGATGGPISILNSTTLSNSDFFTGAFPAEYGDAYSGVFDIKLRKGNNENREYTFQAGVLGIEVAAEGPFTKDNPSSYLFNYRYSSLALLKEIGIKVAGDAVPEFQDATLNVYVPTKRFGSFQVFGIAGLSSIHFDEEDFKETAMTNMGVVGFNHIYPISTRTYIRSSLAVSGTQMDWESFDLESETNDWVKKGYDDLRYVNYRGSMDITHKFSAMHTVKLGGSVISKTYDLHLVTWDEDDDILKTRVDDKGNADIYQSYASWKFRPVDQLTFNTGVHYTYFNLNGKQNIEPRVGLRWQATPRMAFSAGYGQHSKTENISIYMATGDEDELPGEQYNKNLDFIKSNHYIVGYEYRISPNLNMKLEAYYQELHDVPVSADDSNAFSIINASSGYISDRLVNEGTGTTYGLEFTMEKFFSNNYYFLVTTSLFESKYTALDGIERNSRFNNNYIINATGGKEWPVGKKKNNTIGFNLKATYAGGQWYSPIDPVRSAEKEYTYRPYETAYSKQRDAYLRMDTKFSFRRNKKKTTRVWELDIQNVSNTLNVTGDYWDHKDQKIETYTQMGILPVINYRIEF